MGKLGLGPGSDVQCVYRYFDEERWADALCEGNVDPGEATHMYDLRDASSETEASRTHLRHLGVDVGPGFLFENCEFHTQLPDALLLCASSSFDEALLEVWPVLRRNQPTQGRDRRDV